MDKLEEKKAFITGGASGIGLGITKARADNGMNVIMFDLRQNLNIPILPVSAALCL